MESREKLRPLNIYRRVVDKNYCYLFQLFTFNLFHSLQFSPFILHASENHLCNSALAFPQGIHTYFISAEVR